MWIKINNALLNLDLHNQIDLGKDEIKFVSGSTVVRIRKDNKEFEQIKEQLIKSLVKE